MRRKRFLVISLRYLISHADSLFIYCTLKLNTRQRLELVNEEYSVDKKQLIEVFKFNEIEASLVFIAIYLDS